MIRRFSAPTSAAAMRVSRSCVFPMRGFPSITAIAPRPLASAACFFSASPKSLIRGAGGSSSSSSSSSSSGGSWNIMQQQSVQKSSGGGGGTQADAISPAARDHMVRTYSLLGAAVAVCGTGAAACIMTPLGAVPGMHLVGLFGGLGCLMWLSFKPPRDPNMRLALFFAFAALEGIGISKFVFYGALKGVLASALLMTGAIFAGCTAMALLAPRGKLLAMMGPIAGMFLGFMAISLLQMIYPTVFAHNILLYGGMALFSLNIAVSTQAEIEKANCGQADAIQAATGFFLDALNIFIRLIQILGGRD